MTASLNVSVFVGGGNGVLIAPVSVLIELPLEEEEEGLGGLGLKSLITFVKTVRGVSSSRSRGLMAGVLVEPVTTGLGLGTIPWCMGVTPTSRRSDSD